MHTRSDWCRWMPRAWRVFHIGGLAVFVLGMSGCASTNAYFVDRGNDALDIVTLATGFGLGAKVRAGPVQTGLIFECPWIPLIRGGEITPDISTPYVGVPEDHDVQYLFMGEEFTVAGKNRGKGFFAYSRLNDVLRLEERFCEPASIRRRTELDLPFIHLPSRPCPHYFTQIEMSVAIGVSLRLGFNPGELLDFVLGLTTLDIYADDAKNLAAANHSMQFTCKPVFRSRESVSKSNGIPTPTNYFHYVTLQDESVVASATAGYDRYGLCRLLDTNEVSTFTVEIEGAPPRETVEISRVENPRVVIFNIKNHFAPVPPRLRADVVSRFQCPNKGAAPYKQAVYVAVTSTSGWINLSTFRNMLREHDLKLEETPPGSSIYRIFEQKK